MKSEPLLDPNHILGLYPDKDDLLFYLKTKFESPSIELYINGHGKIEGFTCASLDGYIYSTLNKPAAVAKYNYSPNAISEHNDLLQARTELYRITKEELSNSEKSNFFLKVAAGALLLAATSFFMSNHEARKTIEKLQTQLSTPKLIQDTI